MKPLIYHVRRATLDDLGELQKLWSFMRFEADALAKRTTEFQVAEDLNNNIVGAVGLQILQKQGLIHSEAFIDFSQADPVRPQFWERIKTLANNLGVVRLWTLENSSFWKSCGLEKADATAMEKLPATWRELGSEWLTLKLKEDVDELLSADAELALFMEAERRRSEKTVAHARLVKGIATGIAILLLIGVVVASFYLLRRNPNLLFPGRGG